MEKTVLYITCSESTKYGAGEHFFLETARQCRQLGYKTVVQYQDRPRSSAYLQDLRDLDVDVVTVSLKLNPLKILKLIFNAKPEIIHANFANSVLLFEIAIIARLLRVKKLIDTEHCISSPIIRKYVLGLYNNVICVSNEIRNMMSYSRAKGSNLSTLYLGAFVAFADSAQLRNKFRGEFRISAQDKVLACIAFDAPVKGLDILLKSFQKVCGDCPDVRLIIIGVDPEASQLPALARDLGIAHRVHWAGIRDEGWKVLTAADVYVQSSRSEGGPIAVMEAMALKLPIVATRLGAGGELLADGEAGVLCTAGDVDGLTKAIRDMLKQPEAWKRMGEAGYRRYMEMLQGEKVAETLVHDYYLA
ncbi:glycosyltransferase family 4 protein [Bradyrhizobium sp. AZCC 2289]|uniref:glycosyltransferase family 4 protein n=1 Tax=Bradyrhizobium sp. AZCC 2289 TaxID=3117026 RepID=UPI002FF3EA6F